MELDEIADYLIFAIPHELGALDFDEKVFDRTLGEFECDLRRSRFVYTLWVPLLGLQLEQTPIQLDVGLVIDEMTDKEVVGCLEVGLLPNELGTARMRFSKPEIALRIRYEVDRRVGGQRPTVPLLSNQQSAIDQAMAVLRALWIFKEGRVTIPGLLHFSTNWPIKGSKHFTFSDPGLMPWANKFPLSRDEILPLINFWRQFEQVTSTGALASAVRRLAMHLSAAGLMTGSST